MAQTKSDTAPRSTHANGFGYRKGGKNMSDKHFNTKKIESSEKVKNHILFYCCACGLQNYTLPRFSRAIVVVVVARCFCFSLIESMQIILNIFAWKLKIVFSQSGEERESDFGRYGGLFAIVCAVNRVNGWMNNFVAFY